MPYLLYFPESHAEQMPGEGMAVAGMARTTLLIGGSVLHGQGNS